jgi:hypothetical protein
MIDRSAMIVLNDFLIPERMETKGNPSFSSPRYATSGDNRFFDPATGQVARSTGEYYHSMVEAAAESLTVVPSPGWLS